jgi:hypothetical protein
MEFTREILKDQKTFGEDVVDLSTFFYKIPCVLELFQVDGMIKNFVKNLCKNIQPKKVQKLKVFGCLDFA